MLEWWDHWREVGSRPARRRGTEGRSGIAWPLKHAQHIRSKVIPAMQQLRQACDMLEMYTAADLWPMPTYRELLFLK